MPIIKDKYGAKGENIRSKYVTRKKNRAIYTDTINNNLNTEQKRSLKVQEIRNSDSKQHSQGSLLDTNNIPSIVSGFKLSKTNSPENILTLSPGESLKDIIISHYHNSGSAAVLSLHWSTSGLKDLTFKVATGIITSSTGGTSFRLFSETFISNSSISLSDNLSLNYFNNVNKTIYFYSVTSVLGPEFTIIKC